MFEILEKSVLAEGIKSFEIAAPEIAAKSQPGQFIILRIDEKGERIPLTIANYDRGRGSLTLIVQEIGRSTIEMGRMEKGDKILDLVGPLGKASEIKKYGRVICIGGGVGIAPVYPITKALKAKGNEVISIIGARNSNQLILAKEMEAVSDHIHITSDDGTIGKKGFVTDILTKMLADEVKFDLIVAIGSLPMMQAVAEISRPYGIKTIVSMNPIMVDGTGMCGACRVAVGNETKFACVDGPEFDGHQVNWQIARNRSQMFKEEEKIAMEHTHSGGECQCQKKER